MALVECADTDFGLVELTLACFPEDALLFEDGFDVSTALVGRVASRVHARFSKKVESCS